MDFQQHRHKHKQHQPPASGGLSFEYDPEVTIHRHRHFSVANLLIGLATIAAIVGVLVWVNGVRNNSNDELAEADLDSEPAVNVAQPVIEPAAATDASEDLGSTEQDDMLALRDGDPFTSTKPAVVATSIDEIVFGELAELGITPANLCSDGVFLRRAYLSTLGTIPTADQARRFLDDEDPNKRARLIDELLERPEFADYAGMKWCDILRVKAEFPINLWPNAAQAYSYWIRGAMAQNMPYDQFVRELLTSSGSNFRVPPVNFYRAVQGKEPETLAQAVALAFLCQRTDQWDPEQVTQFSKFFSQIGFKPTGEWKEEIVYFDRRKNLAADGESLTATLPDGQQVTLKVGEDPRERLAEWLTRPDNMAFNHAIVNRIWYWTYGRGIVDEPDDMRPDNPASHPELLDLLAGELVESGYDLRHLYRLILNSQTYQLSCVAQSDHDQAGRMFAFFPTRRLEAEVLIDAICKITDTTEVYSSIIPEPFTFLPENQRAVALPDGSITSSFLEMFGRPARDTGLESERNNQLTSAQALHMLNSNHIRDKIKRGPGIQQHLSGNVAENLYLAILSRRPTEEEFTQALSMGVYGPTQDLAWVLINSDEFLYQH